MAKKEETPAFEKGLEQLETIVEELESGDVDLDAALKKFEKGVKLTQGLQKKLEESRRQVKKLLKGPGGEPVEADLQEDGGRKGQDSLF